MSPRARLALFAFAVASAPLGCAAPSPSDVDDVARARAAIVDGVEDPEDSGVVYITVGCTGSLIAPNLVLTAHHCVSEMLEDPTANCGVAFEPPRPASSFEVTANSPVGNAEPARRAAEVLLGPTFPYGDPHEAPEYCGNDIAILVLESAFDPAEAAPLVPRIDEPLVVGEEHAHVGYGRTSDEQGSIPIAERVRRRVDGLEMQCLGDACPSVGGVQSNEWKGTPAGCLGDSGGPAIDVDGRVIGVFSRTDNPVGACGDMYSLFTGLVDRTAWIQEAALHAAEVGGYEPAGWATGWPTDPAYSYPIGAACGEGAQCPSGECLDGICTRKCNADAPCPEGYVCEADVCQPSESGAAASSSSSSSSGGSAEAPPKGEEEDGGCAMGREATAGVSWMAWLLGLVGLGIARRRASRRLG